MVVVSSPAGPALQVPGQRLNPRRPHRQPPILQILPQAPLETPPAGPAAPWLLQGQGLAGERGERGLFSRLDIQLAPGSVTWLRGRNGRGKTSLLRMLAGLASLQAGVVRIVGQTHSQGGPAWRGQWVYIGHQNALKDDLSAAEALRFLAQVHGTPVSDAQLVAALRAMGVLQRQHAAVRTLSQGQKRRVALARLLLSAASPLWLLDEPFDALDADGITALNSVLADHAARGGCVLLTSHQAPNLSQPVPTVLDLDLYACA